ncbi:MAG: DNA primase [Clostridia bacterium]|nr:DNA primase [Clostridia bacterium]
MIPGEIIQQITERSDIVDIISGYTSLKRSGRSATGLCPFHNEKTPSFHVSPDKQVYHCFGCGAGGSVINFIMQAENLTFIDAVKFLGERAGINIPEDNSYDDRLTKQRQRLLEANKAAARFFYDVLLSEDGRKAREYLISRGLSSETITRFGLGFAPESWDRLTKHLKGLGFSDYEIMDSGLVTQRQDKRSYYDRFRNRVMFPIFDVRGNVIAFGGRVMDDSKPKYLNSSDTKVFDKSSNLFALNLARKSDNKVLIMVEGYMDVITLHQYGVTAAVASLGTALTENHARLLKRYADEVVLCYDSDEAGRNAAKRGLEILSSGGVKTRVITLEGAKDPDEYCKKFGVDAFLRAISGAKTPLLYKIGLLKAKYDINSPDEKVEFLNEAARELAKMYNPVEREIYIKEVCAMCDVSEKSLAANVNKAMSANKKTEERKDKNEILKDLKQRSVISGSGGMIYQNEKKLVNLMFYDYEAFRFIIENYDINEMTDAFLKEVALKILKMRENTKTDPKEIELISSFPPEEAGKIADILSFELHFENKTAGAGQIINSLNAAIRKQKLAQLGKSGDLEKIKELLEQKKQNEE